jgi:hypothetical protein
MAVLNFDPWQVRDRPLNLNRVPSHGLTGAVGEQVTQGIDTIWEIDHRSISAEEHDANCHGIADRTPSLLL